MAAPRSGRTKQPLQLAFVPGAPVSVTASTESSTRVHLGRLGPRHPRTDVFRYVPLRTVSYVDEDFLVLREDDPFLFLEGVTKAQPKILAAGRAVDAS